MYLGTRPCRQGSSQSELPKGPLPSTTVTCRHSARPRFARSKRLKVHLNFILALSIQNWNHHHVMYRVAPRGQPPRQLGSPGRAAVGASTHASQPAHLPVCSCWPRYKKAVGCGLKDMFPPPSCLRSPNGPRLLVWLAWTYLAVIFAGPRRPSG